MTDTGGDTSCDDGPDVDDAPDDNVACDDDGSVRDDCWSSDPPADEDGGTEDAADDWADDSRDDREASGDDGVLTEGVDATLAAVPEARAPMPFLSDSDAELGVTTPLVPLPPTVAPPAPPVSPVAGVPGLGGDTAAVLGMVSGRLADAGTIAHAPLGGELDAGLGRAHLAGRASGSMAGLIHQQEIANDVGRHDRTQAAIADARRAEAAAERALDNPGSTLGTLGGD